LVEEVEVVVDSLVELREPEEAEVVRMDKTVHLAPVPVSAAVVLKHQVARVLREVVQQPGHPVPLNKVEPGLLSRMVVVEEVLVSMEVVVEQETPSRVQLVAEVDPVDVSIITLVMSFIAKAVPDKHPETPLILIGL
jgi:hypothetical protein